MVRRAYNEARLVSVNMITTSLNKVATIHMIWTRTGHILLLPRFRRRRRVGEALTCSRTLACASPHRPDWRLATAEAGHQKPVMPVSHGAPKLQCASIHDQWRAFMPLLAEVLNNREFVDGASSAGSTNYYVVAVNNCAASLNCHKSLAQHCQHPI